MRRCCRCGGILDIGVAGVHYWRGRSACRRSLLKEFNCGCVVLPVVLSGPGLSLICRPFSFHFSFFLLLFHACIIPFEGDDSGSGVVGSSSGSGRISIGAGVGGCRSVCPSAGGFGAGIARGSASTSLRHSPLHSFDTQSHGGKVVNVPRHFFPNLSVFGQRLNFLVGQI